MDIVKLDEVMAKHALSQQQRVLCLSFLSGHGVLASLEGGYESYSSHKADVEADLQKDKQQLADPANKPALDALKEYLSVS